MKTKPTEAPILLDCHQSAAFLGISLRKFRDLSKEEGFPAGRALGERSTRWHRGELEAYATSLPVVKRDEPEHLAAARQAKKERKPTANCPFPAPGPRVHKAQAA